jgi:HK97 family phage prohead protease
MTVIVRPMPSEVRYVEGLQIRSIESEGRELDLIVAHYGRWTDVGPFEERMMRGVFDTSLSRHAENIKLVMGHDDSAPGVATPMEWRKADDHLAVTYRFGTHEEARRTAQMAAEGMFGGASVSFLPGKKPGDSVWEKTATGARVTRHQARLLHVGLVTVPADADARLVAMRSMGVPDSLATPNLDEARARLAALRSRWQ